MSKEVLETTRPVRIQQPVRWGDMDALGHVNNTIYFVWFESARIQYMEACGYAIGAEDAQFGPILAKADCSYVLAVKHPDIIEVRVGVSSIGNKSFVMDLQIHSKKRGLVANGEAVMVWYDYAAGHPISVPNELREAIHDVESSAPEALA